MVQIMQIKQAKEYFELDAITGFDAVRDPEAKKGWLLVVSGKDGRSWTLATALGAPKTYATLDSLASEIERISGRISSLHVAI
jgi:hypothetical protein